MKRWRFSSTQRSRSIGACTEAVGPGAAEEAETGSGSATVAIRKVIGFRWCGQHARAGAARVGGNAARVAGASAGARVTNIQDANFRSSNAIHGARSEVPRRNAERPTLNVQRPMKNNMAVREGLRSRSLFTKTEAPASLDRLAQLAASRRKVHACEPLSASNNVPGMSTSLTSPKAR